MDERELVERAKAFADSIHAGRITWDKVRQTINGWYEAGFITTEQNDTLCSCVYECI